MDLILASLYVAGAVLIGQRLPFIMVALCLFIVATIKYAMLLPNNQEFRLILANKIAIDSLGSLLCTLGVCGVLLGYGRQTDIALAALFAAANVYLLLIRPMYPTAREL